jgi:hypothetical protein
VSCSYHIIWHPTRSLSFLSLSLYANGLNNTNIIDLTTSGVTNGDVNDDHNKFRKIEDLFGIQYLEFRELWKS